MNKLPLTMYRNMKVCKDENMYFDGDYDYRTMEIFAFLHYSNDDFVFDHFKISYRHYYSLFGIDRSIKNIKLDSYCISESRHIDENLQNITDYICSKLNIDKYEYGYFKINLSIPLKENKILNSCKFLNKILENTFRNNELLDLEYVNYRCIEYICKDLDSEELDAIIYPEEYTHFKYENN